MKLNLGCGQNPIPGYVNVDKFGEPDVRWDLEQFPWPWEESSVSEIVMNHVLEHLGKTTETFLGIIKEIYRVCRDDARVHIRVPHPRCDDFLNDPTHVRPITLELLNLFSKRLNLRCKEEGWANSPLGLYLDVDFELVNVSHTLTARWKDRRRRENLSKQQLEEAAEMYNNVIEQTAIEMRVIKPSPPRH